MRYVFLIVSVLTFCQTKAQFEINISLRLDSIFELSNQLLVKIKSDIDNKLLKEIQATKKDQSIHLSLAEPLYAYAEAYSGNKMVAATSTFILSTGNVVVHFRELPNVSKVSGGENEFFDLNRFLYLSLPAPLLQEGFSFVQARLNYEGSIPGNRKLEVYWKEYQSHVLAEVKQHANSFFVLDKVFQIRDNISIKILESCYESFSNLLKQTSKGRQLKEYISSSKNILNGMPLPSFQVLDSTGQVYDRAKIYKPGKYMLLDFWASWCVPCREKMKELKALYLSDVDTTKIDIVSISIDKDVSAWLKAMCHDSVAWKSYCDTLAWTGNVVRTFTLGFIPSNVLIDNNGNIVDRNIWGEDLKSVFRRNKLIR